MAITLIAHTEVGAGGTANIDFTSIPQTYDDLMIVSSLQGGTLASASMGMLVQFNSDTGSNYSETGLRNLSGSVSSYGITSGAHLTYSLPEAFSSGTNYPFCAARMHIPNYTNTAGYKQVVIENPGGRFSVQTDIYLTMLAGTWRSTSAITSIRVGRLANLYNMTQYSSISLYGIKRA